MSLQLVDLACPRCGASLRLVPGTATARCPYCEATLARADAAAHALEGDLPVTQRFVVTESGFRERLLAFLAEGDYTPADVLDRASVRHNTGLFAPVYLFEGEWRARWTAAAGFEHRESYVVNVGSGTRRRQETRERRRTDWRPVSGEASGHYRTAVLSSAKIPKGAAAFCEELEGVPDTRSLAALDAAALDAAALEPYAEEAEPAWKARGQARLSAQAEADVRGRIPGDTVKDLHVELRRTDETITRFYRPLWLALYEYAGEAHWFVADGASGRVAGSRPEDKGRRDAVASLGRKRKIVLIVAVIVGLLSIVTVAGPFVVALGAWLWVRAINRELAGHQAAIEAAREARRSALARLRGEGG